MFLGGRKKIKMSKNIIKDLFFIFLLGIFAAVVYNFLLNISPFSIVGDAQRFNGYQAYFLRYSLLQFGQLGLWDPFLGAGMSWISHPGGALFSPAAWIVPFLTNDVTRGSMLLFYIYIFTASFSYYFLGRVLGLARITSFFIGTLAICNQYIFTVVANGWFEEFIGFTIIPLTVAFLWLALSKKSYPSALLGGLALSLNFFINSFYVFHYNVIVLVILSVAFIIREVTKLRKIKRKKYIDLLKLIKVNITFWATGIGLSAIKIIPLLEFRALSSRNSVPLSIIESPDNVMTFPFFNSLIRQFIVPPGFTDKFALYSNSLAFLSITIAVIYCFYKRSFKHAVFLTILIIGVWGYFANRFPLDFYAFVYYLLPGFKSNIFPFRFITIIAFAFFMCIGLGLEIIISQRSKVISTIGIIIGLVIVGGASLYAFQSYRTVTYPRFSNVKQEIKQSEIIINKPKTFNQVPQIKTSHNPNLLAVLSSVVREYKPEGRVYSTFSSPDEEFLANQIILEEKIPVIRPSYEPIVATYLYPITYKEEAVSDIALVKKRYIFLSILNVRFQHQQKDKFEYNGCRNLNIGGFIAATPSANVCNFLESRLTKIYDTKTGGIFYDSDVLPRFIIIPNAILVISNNQFNDFSGFIAKQITFHEDFDLNTITILSGTSSYLDDYDLETLKQFPGVLLVEPKIKDKKNANSIIKQYEKNGGKILYLTSKWNHYESLHDRSGSIFTNNPAWSYSDKDSQLLSNLFNSLKTDQEEGTINVIKFTPEDVVLSIKTTKDNQAIQFSDSFYPGWKAEVDKKPANVYMADGLVKGVVIKDAGDHEVRFFYSPDSLKIGAMVTGGTTLTLLLAGLYRRGKNIK